VAILVLIVVIRVGQLMADEAPVLDPAKNAAGKVRSSAHQTPVPGPRRKR
jgi:hypothetical protein